MGGVDKRKTVPAKERAKLVVENDMHKPFMEIFGQRKRPNGVLTSDLTEWEGQC